MKLGISMWSYVSHYKRGDMTVESFLDTARDLGADGVELLDFFWRERETELARVKNRLGEMGMPVSAYAIGNNLTEPDEQTRRRQVESIFLGVDTARLLGTDRVRVFAGNPNEGVDYDTGLNWIVEGLRQGARYAEESNVLLCLENHGLLAGRADQVRHIIDSVGSPALLANPDTGNFMLVNQNPVTAIRELAPITGSVHFKDFRKAAQSETEHVYQGLNGSRVVGAAIGEGDVDLRKVVEILHDSGYDGYLTIEYEGAEDPATAMPRSVEFARGLINGIGK
jgi:sugar phosphate isomerase/epimerase